MKPFIYLITASLVFFTLSACQTSPNAVALQTQAHSWIDAPLDGSQLPLAPVEIVAHSSDLFNIVSVELSVNGNVIATVPNADPSRLLAGVQQTWTPPAPGNYTIRVRALNSSSIWGDYAEADVTIGLVTSTAANPARPPLVPASTDTPTPTPSVSSTGALPFQPPALQPPTPTHTSAPNVPKPTATHTHTPQPTHTPVVVTKPTLNDHSVSASQFYWGGGNCTPKQVTFKVSASDPSGIASVHLLFRLASQSNWTDLAMTGSGDIWSRTLDSENDVPGYSSSTNTVFLQFYFVLTNKQGQQTQSQTFPNSVSLSYCPAIK